MNGDSEMTPVQCSGCTSLLNFLTLSQSLQLDLHFILTEQSSQFCRVEALLAF